MSIHYSSRNCGTPNYAINTYSECKCLMNVNGSCHGKSMQKLAKDMLKDRQTKAYVCECPKYAGILMVSEYSLKSEAQ